MEAAMFSKQTAQIGKTVMTSLVAVTLGFVVLTSAGVAHADPADSSSPPTAPQQDSQPTEKKVASKLLEAATRGKAYAKVEIHLY
jgi:hypothetical protein